MHLLRSIYFNYYFSDILFLSFCPFWCGTGKSRSSPFKSKSSPSWWHAGNLMSLFLRQSTESQGPCLFLKSWGPHLLSWGPYFWWQTGNWRSLPFWDGTVQSTSSSFCEKARSSPFGETWETQVPPFFKWHIGKLDFELLVQLSIKISEWIYC